VRRMNHILLTLSGGQDSDGGEAGDGGAAA